METLFLGLYNLGYIVFTESALEDIDTEDIMLQEFISYGLLIWKTQ